MNPREIASAIAKRSGGGAVVATAEGQVVASVEVPTPETMGAAATFVLACARKVGDALALGDPLYVLGGIPHRSVGFCGGTTWVVGFETPSRESALSAAQEAVAILQES